MAASLNLADFPYTVSGIRRAGPARRAPTPKRLTYHRSVAGALAHAATLRRDWHVWIEGVAPATLPTKSAHPANSAANRRAGRNAE